jgi:5-methyltetrahydropteroyltriglutamate--homocysteine methyltransferase
VVRHGLRKKLNNVSMSIPRRSPSGIGRFAPVVGRERVTAGADCGFASFSTTCEVYPTVVWAKLAA